MTSSPVYPLLVTCPKGLEGLLAEELASLGLQPEREQPGGVRAQASRPALYHCALFSRLANRLLLPLAAFQAADAEQLYRGAREVDWPGLFRLDSCFEVDAQGTNPGLRHSHFAALRVKDAVVDRFREGCGERPRVAPGDADLRVHLRLRGSRAELFLDLVGDSLHRRGYRLRGAAAPLKENLAAALLLRADWPGVAARGGALIDPMCGSGTLLIEGALMALGIPPGFLRRRWSLEHWRGHDPAAWDSALHAAAAARERARTLTPPEIRGYDASPAALRAAEENIARAGLETVVRVSRKALSQWVRPTHREVACGLVICNPPYGERLGEADELPALYRSLGERLRQEFVGFDAAVFTGNPELGKVMGLRSHKQYRLYNGSLPSRLLLFRVRPEAFVDAPPPESATLPPAAAPAVPGPGAEMLANRLRKNLKRLSRWRRREGIECYRLYDADMPEYAVAVDIYAGRPHVAEYAPPRSVSPEAAGQRLQEALHAVAEVCAVAPERIALKRRSRQRGSEQYQPGSGPDEWLTVGEGRAQLWVNLTGYLDTGLFLDHRPVRRWIGEWAAGKRFLNLFCYTAAATVQAALGGARESVSVDLSATYLDWAGRNLALNGIDTARHQLVRADCREWLDAGGDGFDLILLDPPTFSNSKRMEGVLDLQRDHAELINAALRRLNPGGTLIFSCNRRRFKLEREALHCAQIEEVTRASLDPDFERSGGIHQCWLLRA